MFLKHNLGLLQQRSSLLFVGENVLKLWDDRKLCKTWKFLIPAFAAAWLNFALIMILNGYVWDKFSSTLKGYSCCKNSFATFFFGFDIIFDHMRVHIPNIGSLALSQRVINAAEHKPGHNHLWFHSLLSNTLCKTGSSILAQGLTENIAQVATPQHSIKTKAFRVHTIR